MTFEYEHLPNVESVRAQIEACEGRHVQQAVFSTFHNGLTQICFGCRKIRSSIYRPELEELPHADQ